MTNRQLVDKAVMPLIIGHMATSPQNSIDVAVTAIRAANITIPPGENLYELVVNLKSGFLSLGDFHTALGV